MCETLFSSSSHLGGGGGAKGEVINVELTRAALEKPSFSLPIKIKTFTYIKAANKKKFFFFVFSSKFTHVEDGASASGSHPQRASHASMQLFTRI